MSSTYRLIALLLTLSSGACSNAPTVQPPVRDVGGGEPVADDAYPGDRTDDASTDSAPDVVADTHLPPPDTRDDGDTRDRSGLELRTDDSVADPGAVDAALPPPHQGLEVVGEFRPLAPTPHFSHLLALGDTIFIADASEPVFVGRLEEDGALVPTYEFHDPEGPLPRCTTVALHTPSNTLFCASDDHFSDHGMAYYDISAPETPALRALDRLPEGEDLFIRDLQVIGDRLLLSRFDLGLWSASIHADGSLGALRHEPIAENVRFTAQADRGLVALTSAGLLTLESTPTAIEERGRLSLDGPPNDLATDGDLAVVAMGSAGVFIVDVSGDTPRLVDTVRPPAVATTADLAGSALAVGTTTGVFLYELTETGHRLAGFHPVRRIALDVHFVGDFLVVSDWYYVRSYRFDLTGAALAVDLPRGRYIAPGDDVRFPLRNLAPVDLRVELRLWADSQAESDTDPVIADVLVPVGEDVEITVPADVYTPGLRESGRSERQWVPIGVRTYLASGPGVGTDVTFQEHDGPHHDGVDRVQIVVALPDRAPTDGHPPPGSSFTPIVLLDEGLSEMTLPLDGSAFRFGHFSTGCAAMWAQIEDMAWLSRTDSLDPGVSHLFASQAREEVWQGFIARWNVRELAFPLYGFGATPEIREQNTLSMGAGSLYEEHLQVIEIRGAAADPTDYVVGADGTVLAVERVYRGIYPLP